MTKILNSLAILCVLVIMLGVWQMVYMWPIPESIWALYWRNYIFWTVVYVILAACLCRQQKFAMIFVLLGSVWELSEFRNLGFSPLLFFSMGIQAKLSIIELLLAVALSIVGIAMWIYPNIKNKGIAHVH